MPRIRTLKPEWPQHYKIAKCSDRARVLHACMITQADDEGRLVADPAALRVLAWAHHPDVTIEMVNEALEELVRVDSVRVYCTRNALPRTKAAQRPPKVQYAYFPSWKDHQRIDKPKPSKLPIPPTYSPRLSQTSRDASPNDRDSSTSILAGSEGKGREGKGSERKGGERGGEPMMGLGSGSNSNQTDQTDTDRGLALIAKATGKSVAQLKAEREAARLRELEGKPLAQPQAEPAADQDQEIPF